MSFDATYGLLFEVTFLHNYFLNNGEETFASMTNADKQKMLQQFSTDAFLVLTPTLETNTVLKNYKMTFKKTKTGFRIYTKVKDEFEPFIKIPANLNLTFLIKINDYQFENYTNLDFALTQAYHFSNVKPLTEPVSFEYLPKISDNKLISNAYLVSEETTAYLVSALEPSEQQNVFGIISLTAKGDNSSGNIVNTLGKMLSPNFKIHFDNRKTLWKYINRKAGTEIKTNAAKPLTRSGFVEIDPLTDFTPAQPAESQYPNPSVKSITKINSDYYSEIFI
ncbi:hypothetical protein [Flavobacterium johnsoniae]|uniref:Uncharacterized protein n=1 Tax=Flavobacterium johnsoniae (strain ATCC 17061 / DSM 2064 / JCM 8514 / BCRC 14874 / CCUG 350202 / NBRC 14942 / NCIMB 11054 / UW101) TaxID=376686 RepID=A5FF44_FLAJ1|nr:hypothetical protein [Flavobacterium johnsoniae]ABQ06166.1 hypothetical protein Fjoh_3149 [Flavobacterium johnsoniae UW101]OXE98360.1 hypothetical protein B0A63_15550 [Flavobacterium johnsoniae UW101]WQG81912.1 hypothetical protein SR927_02160 [Flavobacterium johnsoniae UW101]SHK67700.1 hypothetical protein SAMN05444146_1887 [Flavobacterium johnsoniae]